MFYIGFFYLKNERIAHVAHQKRATMSDLLRSHTKMRNQEQIAQVAHQKGANEQIACFFLRELSFAHFWAKSERFAQEIDERIPSPDKKLYF